MAREKATKLSFIGFIISLVLFVVLSTTGKEPFVVTGWAVMIFMFISVLINFIVMKKTQGNPKEETSELDKRY